MTDLNMNLEVEPKQIGRKSPSKSFTLSNKVIGDLERLAGLNNMKTSTYLNKLLELIFLYHWDFNADGVTAGDFTFLTIPVHKDLKPFIAEFQEKHGTVNTARLITYILACTLNDDGNTYKTLNNYIGLQVPDTAISKALQGIKKEG